MITVLLVTLGLFLLLWALKTFMIGQEMSLDQLRALNQALSDFTKDNRIIAQENKKGCISFQSDFVQAVKIRSVYLSSRSKGFAAVWSNGRSSHFVADTDEEMAALLTFALLLQGGMAEKVLEDVEIESGEAE